MGTNILHDEWVERARTADIVSVAQRLPGVNLKRAGAAWVGPCPACGGCDRFAVDGRRQLWNCRGAEGGDVIRLVEHVMGLSFLGAVEWITGVPRPGFKANIVDLEAERRRREKRRAEEAARLAQEARTAAKLLLRVDSLWQARQPFLGSHAEAYMRFRGIVPISNMTTDLGFLPALPYWGYADVAATETRELGVFPCMIAAIRDVGGTIIGLHRTYLDTKSARKLAPPGDALRNGAKKIFGRYKGGLIRLGPPAPILAVGEGLETCLSWYDLTLEHMSQEIGLACAVALNNMAGGSTGTIPHPADVVAKRSNPRARCRSINNGIPDMARPGFALPGDVESVILLGDGDSDPVATRAQLLCGMRRYQALGLETSLSIAPEKCDWNDVLMQSLKSLAA